MAESNRITSDSSFNDKNSYFSVTHHELDGAEDMYYPKKDAMKSTSVNSTPRKKSINDTKAPKTPTNEAGKSYYPVAQKYSNKKTETSTSQVYAPDPVSEGILDKIYQSHIYNEVSAVQPFKTKAPANSPIKQTDSTEKVIGYTTRPGNERILSEEVVTRQIKVPKRVVHQDTYEKIITIEETVLREEVVDTVQNIDEKIIKFTRPNIREKLVEVNTIQYQEEPVEVIEKIPQERVRHVPKIEQRVRDVEVPKYVTNQRIVEVPEVEIRQVPVEKIVEVPQIKEKFIIKPVPVPEYVEKPVPQEIVVEKPVEIQRNIPEPMEVISTVEYHLPQMKPKIEVVKYPLYVPRFIEVPVAAELFNSEEIALMNNQLNKLKNLTQTRAVGLKELEELTESCCSTIAMASARMTPENYEVALSEAWKNGKLDIKDGAIFNMDVQQKGAKVSETAVHA